MIICKLCNNDKFLITTTRSDIAPLLITAAGVITIDHITEGPLTSSSVITSCSKCLTPYDTTKVSEVYACNGCQGLFDQNDLEENDICFSCNNPREDLIGLKEIDYIKMIIELEKQISSTKTTRKRTKKEDQFKSIDLNNTVTSDANIDQIDTDINSAIDSLFLDDDIF